MLSSAVLPIVVFVVQAIFRSSGAVSTGSRADNPWLWVSDEQELVPRNKGDGLLEVVEIIDDPNAVNYKSQPRFIGHLKRKLCRVGVGVGCPGGRDRTRYTIEPQEINYVQPLMIQAVGKPIPAVPAVPTKRKDRRDKKRPKNEQKKLEKIQSDRETKSSAVPVTTKPINPLLSNALLSSQLNLLGSQSDFSNPFTNTGLGLSSSNFMAQPPKGPPPAVYKDSQTQMLSPGNVPQNPYSNFNSLSQTIRDHALAKTPLTMESFLASQSLDLNPASNGHIIRTADPGLFKANLINSLTSIPGFSSATDIGKTRTTSNFGVFQNTQNPSQLSLNSPNQVQTNRLISNQNSFIAPLRPNSNPINNNFLQNGITSDPNLLNVRTNHNPPQKIKVLNLSTRPKKEAIVSNESVEEKAKVIKHIHVHKHIHQMDEDTPTNVAQKVHDNLDSFSTSVFSTTDPAYNTRTKLQSDFRGSHRSKKRHRNLDSTPIANSVRSNIGSCTCVLKQECPSDLVSDFDINAKDDFRVTQDTRRNRQNFAASHSSSITSLDSRVMPENKTFPVSLQQIIKPRKNNMIPNNQFQVGNEERKIVLNLKRVTKRDIYSVSRNTNGKQEPVDSDVVDSAYMRKPKETYDSKLAHLASNAKNLNLKANHKRDLTELLNNDLEFNTFSARQLQLDDLPFSCGLHEVCCNIDNFGTSFNDIGVTIPPSSESRTCGRSTVTTIKGRISSGSRHSGEAKFGEFPWQAAILKKEGRDSVYVCAGSLIDKSHILTAAHCVEGYDADHLRIRLGEWDVNRDTEFYAHLEYDVVGVAVHPDFYSGNLINDVALLRMLYPVDINNTPHVSPICLPSSRVSFAGSRCWVSGWGKNAFGKNGKYQNLLKKIDIPVLPRTACENILRETRLGPDYSLHPGMMCAGGEPEKDACKGDGGGPLSCRDVDGSFVLSGIVSWGIGCGQPGIPGVYVNVEYYVAWIRKMLKS